MHDEIILEIEQRVITLTHAEIGRGSFHLVSCQHVPVRGLRAGDVAEAVDKLFSSAQIAKRRAHVVLGDRRFVHRKLDLPRLAKDDLVGIVHREVMREAKLEGNSQVRFDCRILASKSSAKMSCAVVGLPLDAWQPVQAGLTRAGVTVASLTSVEDAATAICCDGGFRHVAVLDLAGCGARFVQSEDGAVVRVRRFPLPGVDADGDATDREKRSTTHLGLEIRRTLDHFKSAGMVSPEVLILSHHVEGGPDLIKRVTGEVPRTEWFQLESNLCETGLTPGLAALGTIRRLATRTLRDILSDTRIEVPLSKTRSAIALIVAGLTIVLSTATAWLDHRVNMISYAEQRLSGQASILERLGAEDRALRQAMIESREKLDRALHRRRPYSLAVSAICNAATKAMSLDAMSLGERGEIVIEGTVREVSRLRALETIGEFTGRLRALPYLRRPVESVDESIDGEVIHFRVSAQWRQS